MRILHITDNYEFVSGIRRYVDGAVALLQRAGHETEIYSPPGAGEELGSYLSRWLSVRYYREVGRVIERFKPDILHAHSLSLRLSPLPLLAARQRAIPVVMTVHDFNYVCPRKWLVRRDGRICSTGFGIRCLCSNCPSGKSGWPYLLYHDLRWLKTALHRRMLRRWVDVFITPSVVLREWTTKNFAAPKVVHIPNFVARGNSPPAAVPDPDQLLLVGRLSKEKGVACLLAAMPLVLAECPGARLTVVGDGPERGALERLANDLDIGGSIRFEGMLAPDSLPAYYAAATVCVLPSLWMENGPVAGLEALAYGRALVGSDRGGTPELIENGRTGFLFKAGDSADLAEKIVRLLRDPALAKGMGRRAFEVYEARFSEARHAEKLTAIYAAVTAGRVQ